MKLTKLVFLLIFACSSAYAVDYEDIVIYRGIDGELTEASKNDLKELRKEARLIGQIKIWIMFDMGFQANPALRTPEVVQAEAAVKASMIADVVVPLSGRVALLTTPEGLGGAPGVMVEATERGLFALARDTRVKHITYHP